MLDSYARIAESKIEYLQTPDSHSTLTRLMGGEELEQLAKSRKWKQWAKDQAALIDLRRKRMLDVVEKLKASLDGALEHEGAHPCDLRLSSSVVEAFMARPSEFEPSWKRRRGIG